MTKCVYCSCTATIPAGKGFCEKCGHDAVAHVASAPAAGGNPPWLTIAIIVGAIAVGTFYFANPRHESMPDRNAAPRAEAPPPAMSNAPSAPPPPASETSADRSTPPAPPLGSWRTPQR